ncbi:Rv0361 family membrane protein [Actinomadura spongiicola]|uniref:Rv0361 family membrane protein n=1 Tax=Actinomadura spongiicola TaxID=2303421 RepID=UPI0011C14FD2|nr:hypothetical protein [Actinomadura spongiicola]
MSSSSRLRVRKALVAAAALVVVAALAVAFWMWRDDGGAESPRAMADSYVSALNHGDQDELRKLYHPDSRDRADSEVKTFLRRYGSKSIKLGDVQVIQDFGPDEAKVQITGTGEGIRLSETLYMGRRDGSWYLAAPPN